MIAKEREKREKKVGEWVSDLGARTNRALSYNEETTAALVEHLVQSVYGPGKVASPGPEQVPGVAEGMVLRYS